MKTIAIVQARLGSTRFPRKVLADLNGRPVLHHVVERASKIQGVDEVIVACPMCDQEPLSQSLRTLDTFRLAFPPVPDSDVLGRYYHVAKEWKADTIVRITADCPLICPDLAEIVLRLYAFDGAYARVPSDLYIDGLDVEVMSMAELENSHAYDTDTESREHVTLGILQRRGLKPAHRLLPRLSIDTVGDLKRVAAVMARTCDAVNYRAVREASASVWWTL